MNFAFNMIHSGLGNNGGTRTVLKSAEVIENLGHRCDLIANVDNFTWFEHKPTIKYIPEDLDAIINVAAVDIISTLNINTNATKAWYIRGHETWANSEETLAAAYKLPQILNIVNSRGLQKQLLNYGAESKVVYQGIDFELWENRELRPKDKIRIGCLYQKKKTKRWHDFIRLADILGNKNYEYIGIGTSKRTDSFLTRFWYNASNEDLNNAYSSCHIWFAPSELEGLHNVPIEAALCGCLIVANDNPMNGMVLDYTNENTAMIYEARNIKQAVELIKDPDWALISVMERTLKNEIGTREHNMKKLIQYLEAYDGK